MKKISLIFLATLLVLSPTRVFASDLEKLTPSERSLFRTSGITMWNPYGRLIQGSDPCFNVSGVGGITLSGNTTQEKIWSGLKSTGKFTDIQIAGIMGNLSGESGSRITAWNHTNKKTGEQYSDLWEKGAYGLAQWLGTRKTPLLESMVSAGFGKLIPKNDRATVLKYNTTPDKLVSEGLLTQSEVDSLLAFQLSYLASESRTNGRSGEFFTSPYTDNLERATWWWYKYWESPCTDESPCGDTAPTGRLNAAQKALDQFGGTTSSSSSSSTTPSFNTTPDYCNAAGTSGGSILEAALSMAWPDDCHYNALTEEYRYWLGQNGWKTNDSSVSSKCSSINTSSGKGDVDGQDCARFVGAVIKKTGLDPGFPTGDTKAQTNYLERSSLWANVGTTANTQPQPGDILIIPRGEGGKGGHVTVYGGSLTFTKKGKTVTQDAFIHASSNQRTGNISSSYTSLGGRYFRIFRYVGNSSSTEGSQTEGGNN